MLWTTRWNTGTTFIRLLIFTCFFTLLAAGCGSGKSQVAVDEYRCGDERYLAEKAEFNSFCFAGMEVVHQPDGITGIQTRMTIPAQWVAPAAHTEYGEYPVFWRDLKDGEFFSEHTRITVDEGTAFNFVEFGGVRLGVRSENVLGTGAEPTYFWQVIVTEKNWFDCEPRREQCPDRADGMSKVEPDILGWEGSFPVPKEEIGDTVELRIHAPHGAGKVMLSVSGPKTKFSREVVTDDPVVCDPAWCRAALGQVLTGTQGSAVGLSTLPKRV